MILGQPRTEAALPNTVAEIAARHGFGLAAAQTIADALRRGGGRMAQFNHPELGGMGQWTAGGMLMIGDMFNDALKVRVGALCRDLAATPELDKVAEDRRAPTHWWPEGLGHASATGAQNDMHYACFPEQRRLALLRNGTLRVYDTGTHRISGFSQQQGDDQRLTFRSQQGLVRLEDLVEV